MRLRFDDFVLDSGRRELMRAGAIVRLTPRTFRLLEILAGRRPDAVSRKELYDALWPDTFVQPNNLDDVAWQLRRALDDGDQRIIRTVFGFGLSFGADAVSEEIAPGVPHCQLVVGPEEVDLREGENLVGRGRDCIVRIDHTSISRHHARIVIRGTDATLEDLSSKNGTWLEGRRVRAPLPLPNGAKVTFGTVTCTFRNLPPDPSTETSV